MSHSQKPDAGCPNKNHPYIHLNCRHCRIVELLRSYHNVLAVTHEPGLGDGDGVPLLPREYHEGSYRQLELGIQWLFQTRPVQAKHLTARYRDCDRKRQTIYVPVRTPHGNTRNTASQQLMEVWPAWVRMQKVRLALDALSLHMPEDIDLPAAVRYRTTKAA